MARKSKAEAQAGAVATEEVPAPEPDAAPAAATPAPPPPAAAAAASGPVHGAGESGGDQFSVNHYLNLGDLFTTPRNATEEERQRTAAADFQAAIAPAFAGMDGPPPAAMTPEDAVRDFVAATGEALPDPNPNLASTIYRNETAAYYRIRRHFMKGVGRMQPGWQPPPGLGPPN